MSIAGPGLSTIRLVCLLWTPVVVLAVAVAVLLLPGVDSTERSVGRSYWCTILLAASECIQGEEKLLHLGLGIWQPLHVEEIGL